MKKIIFVFCFVLLMFLPVSAENGVKLSGPELSMEEKVYGLALLWKEAEYNFGFWDKKSFPSWDKAYREALPRVIETKTTYEYYKELQRFIYLLQDGHTDVWLPDDLYAFLPIKLEYVDGRYTVVKVAEEFSDKMPLLSCVTGINGMPAEKYLQRYIYPYCWRKPRHVVLRELQCNGKLGDRLKLETVIPGGRQGNVEVEYLSAADVSRKKILSIKPVLPSEKINDIYKSGSHNICMTEDNIAVITIPTFGNDKFREEYRKNLHLLKDTSGLIIDIRNNGGGSSANGYAVSRSLMHGNFVVGTIKNFTHIAYNNARGQALGYAVKTPDEALSSFTEKSAKEFYEEIYLSANRRYFMEKRSALIGNNDSPLILKQPVVVLTNEKTGSAAENLLLELDLNKRVTIVGTVTLGSTGQPLVGKLPGGGRYRICTQQWLYPDGREFVGKGIKPHIESYLSLDDYKNGRDSVMDKGLETLRNMLK